MASGTINVLPSCSMYWMVGTGGQYYRCRVQILKSDRFPFLVLPCRQDGPLSPVTALVQNSYGSNQIFFSDQSVYYDNTTNTLTVDIGNSGWAHPAIIYNPNWIQFTDPY